MEEVCVSNSYVRPFEPLLASAQGIAERARGMARLVCLGMVSWRVKIETNHLFRKNDIGTAESIGKDAPVI